MTENTPQLADFEPTLRELEALVEAMEKGDLTLEDSLKAFERGIALTRQCQQALNVAEQKVKVLMDKTPHSDTVDFDRED